MAVKSTICGSARTTVRMSLPIPHSNKRPTTATSPKPERSLRFSQSTDDVPVQLSPTPFPNSAAMTAHLDANAAGLSGRAMLFTSEPPAGSVFIPSSPPVVGSRLRKASSSSQLDRDSAGYRMFEHDISNEDDEDLRRAKSSRHRDQDVGLRPRVGNISTSRLRHEKPISTGRVRGAGETETELDEPVSPHRYMNIHQNYPCMHSRDISPYLAEWRRHHYCPPLRHSHV